MNPSYISSTYSKLYAQNIEESALWYCENFGFKVLSIHSSFATLQIAPGRILFLSSGEDQPRSIGLLTHNIVALHRHLKVRGVEIEEQSDDTESTWFSTKDISGNRIEVWVGDRFGLNKVEYHYPPKMEKLKHGCELLLRPPTRWVAMPYELPPCLEYEEMLKLKEEALTFAKVNAIDAPSPEEWAYIIPSSDPGPDAQDKSERITIYFGFAANGESTVVPAGWTTIDIPAQRYARVPIYGQHPQLSNELHKKYKLLKHWHNVIKLSGNQDYCLMVQSDEFLEVLYPYSVEQG